MSQRRNILFATIAAGGGHVATARAMAESVEDVSDGTVTGRVSDVMAEFGPRSLDRQHKASWRWLLRHPVLVRTAQRGMDAVPAATRLWQRALLAGFARNLVTVVRGLEPDLVVANHGWLATAFALAQRRHGLALPVLTYATEPFDASALWSEPWLERALTASRAARDDLVRLGIPEERIDVVGYPVQRRFRQPPPRSEARRSLGLAEAFTCLVSLGAEGFAGDAPALIRDLAATGVQVVVIAGRNRELLAQLQTLADELPAVTVRGFVEDMERYLAAADVMVGKAGPASVMEALAVGRPVLVTAYAGLNEQKVVAFLQDRGLGWFAPDRSTLLATVRRLRNDPATTAAAQERVAGLDFDAMADGIGHYLSYYATHREPPPDLVDRGLP